VGNETIGRIAQGMLVLLAVAQDDTRQDAEFLVKKVTELRIFEDKEGKMNISAQDFGAEFLVVSQFTLLGDCSKGRRPSFDKAASPQKAEELYQYFVQKLKEPGMKVETGQFRAMMDVHLVNDGPVTLVIDS